MAPRGRPRSFDRHKALQQAMEVFWERGFDSASMAELTRAMEINSPSLYSAFGSKEALFREAVELYITTGGSGIWGPLNSIERTRDAVSHVLHATALTFTQYTPSRGCMIVLASPQSLGTNPAIGDELEQHRNGNRDCLKQRLQRAVDEGELDAGIDCNAIANYYATVQHGMSIMARDGATRQELFDVASCAMAAWEALTAGSGTGSAN